ncbi:DNA/RNA non-specific endonuclease [Sinorhizobium meliloti]|uniref:DNA/RNA non-specific endonuclease n=1 Tax=Rhizobium meliloti TaxID=382 RepID=UPI00030E80A1|nr:DNA/RNA non-specific endonuclease [Sinorhizobium meliloti]UDU21355.1 DNA/RNA non-specific endonuclease [Sinorhizobium meliloti]
MFDQTVLEGIKRRFRESLPAGTDVRAVVTGAMQAFADRSAADAATTTLESVTPPLLNTEAIVQRYIRPPMLIRDDRIVYTAVPHFPELSEEAVRGVEHMVPSVGRVEFLNHSMRWGGTGFVVERLSDRRSLFVTNRHVAEIVARRVRDGSGVFLRSNFGVPYSMKIDMREEVGSPADLTFELKAERIRYLADFSEPDVALIEIETRTDLSPEPLLLAERPARDRELVATIGYPAYDDRNDLTQMREYFGDLFDVKRFAGGLIMQEPGSIILRHDCTTLGGNSGSSLISLDQKRVVGLHFQGEFGIENAAVGVETLKRLLSGARGPLVRGIEFESVAERADGSHEAAFFDGREGYTPSFLGEGLTVSWPAFDETIAHDLARPSDSLPDRPFELRYTHFGVLYSAGRRCARVTAVNIDGSSAVRIKRGDDQWFFDLRIPLDFQVGQSAYRDPQIDRGHMVRREDPNWGSAASKANYDTFHYTNSALQHSILNQGKTLWQGLENYILDSARTEGFKACVFTGPVLRDEDPSLERGGPQVPIEFWKIVVMEAVGGGLHATGYVLSQGDLIRDLLAKRGRSEAAEGFVLGAYRTFQVAVSHIEELTGLRFDELRGADPFADIAGLHETVNGDMVGYRPLETFDDLVLDGRAVSAVSSSAADETLSVIAEKFGVPKGKPLDGLGDEAESDAPTILDKLLVLQDRKAMDADELSRLFQAYHLAVASPRSYAEASAPNFESLRPEYERLFATCEILPEKRAEVERYVARLRSFKPRYRRVAERMGIPWWFVGLTHALEASFNFQGHLHNGDPLSARTVQVPRGRPLVWNPPNDWEASAIDALAMKGYAGQSDWSVARSLYRLERYNGWGYRRSTIRIPTPYLWSFSRHYTKGKFVRDGIYDPRAVSKQCGAAVMLKALGVTLEVA